VATPAVGAVRHPGLPGDPAHEVASRQMARYGGLVTAVLDSAAAAGVFLAAAGLVTDATSFGDLRTTADRRARWGDAAPEGLLRISAGVEDTADLVADVAAALDAVVDSRT